MYKFLLFKYFQGFFFSFQCDTLLTTSWRARHCPREKNHFFNLKHPPATHECKFQPIRSSRLAGYRQHIYIRMFCFIIWIRFFRRNDISRNIGVLLFSHLVLNKHEGTVECRFEYKWTVQCKCNFKWLSIYKL